jgi:hypothetical protein
VLPPVGVGGSAQCAGLGVGGGSRDSRPHHRTGQASTGRKPLGWRDSETMCRAAFSRPPSSCPGRRTPPGRPRDGEGGSGLVLRVGRGRGRSRGSALWSPLLPVFPRPGWVAVALACVCCRCSLAAVDRPALRFTPVGFRSGGWWWFAPFVQVAPCWQVSPWWWFARRWHILGSPVGFFPVLAAPFTPRLCVALRASHLPLTTSLL